MQLLLILNDKFFNFFSFIFSTVFRCHYQERRVSRGLAYHGVIDGISILPIPTPTIAPSDQMQSETLGARKKEKF